ncbi:MAG: hypothetical protein JSU65_14340 [Candidatus Zixiibacteriota bacterium]|nr:MAG: hypothetical protein JSU65_14340 [candidate division Zixibacteria bacterium]
MVADLADKLRAEGWKERFTASGTRLREAIEEYRALGFEVKTVPVKELGADGCTVCFDDENDATEMIFTRKSSVQ